jgi:hypothetical protein
VSFLRFEGDDENGGDGEKLIELRQKNRILAIYYSNFLKNYLFC